jgi:hypothetical protein
MEPVFQENASTTSPTVTMSLPLVFCTRNRNRYAGCDKVE